MSRVIEPLKARAAALVPGMARHPNVLRRIVAARGRVDPGALVLGVQGLAALRNLARIWRLLVRGKINPAAHLAGPAHRRGERRRRLLGQEETQRGEIRKEERRKGRAANEVCLLPRLLGAQHLRRAQ